MGKSFCRKKPGYRAGLEKDENSICRCRKLVRCRQVEKLFDKELFRLRGLFFGAMRAAISSTGTAQSLQPVPANPQRAKRKIMISLDRISATGTPSAPATHPTSTQNQPAIDPAPARNTPATRPDPRPQHASNTPRTRPQHAITTPAARPDSTRNPLHQRHKRRGQDAGCTADAAHPDFRPLGSLRARRSPLRASPRDPIEVRPVA